MAVATNAFVILAALKSVLGVTFSLGYLAMPYPLILSVQMCYIRRNQTYFGICGVSINYRDRNSRNMPALDALRNKTIVLRKIFVAGHFGIALAHHCYSWKLNGDTDLQ